MNTTSYWSDSISLPSANKIKADCQVDVAIVGGGITGITAAYLLKQEGCTVALLERGRFGGFDTSNTTAHLTCVTDSRISELVKRFGKDGTRLVWEGGRAAMDQICTNIRQQEIACDFKWLPGFYHEPIKPRRTGGTEKLLQDAKLANDLGFAAKYQTAVPLMKRPGIEFSHQAIFHPLKYLASLLRAIPGQGSYVFENAEAGEVGDKPLTVQVGKYKVRCSYLILATHNPLMGRTNVLSAALLQTKLFLYTTYALAAKIPPGVAPEASFWDTGDPYYYLRVERKRGFDYAIYGGEDHKTGQTKNPAMAYKRLETAFRRLFPDGNVTHRWSGQIVETADGLPSIGETAPRQFVATGFSGNGMTFGTLGAMMAVDAFLKRKNPWRELFDVHRKALKLRAAGNYLKENKDYPYFLVRDWIARGESKSARSVQRNEGKIIQLKGHKVAAYRDEHGKLFLRSPVCTHLQCIVGWNNAEKTWDCPCHGSRFAGTGEVLSGPAEAPLKPVKGSAD